VDYASAQAKLPPALVEKAISATRGGQRITTEDHFREPVLRGGQLRIGPGNQANIVDYGATSRRQGTVDDVLKGLVLCNELPHVRSAMPLVTPANIPQVMGDLYGYYLCALYSKKPFGVYIMTPESARQIIRIAEIRATGGKPHVGYLLEPNGALSYDEISLQMAISFVEAGHSFHLGPMAMAGLDAPVTLAGCTLPTPTAGQRRGQG
jgi:trimethylamine:corrinoid methyltransferase-like protein